MSVYCLLDLAIGALSKNCIWNNLISLFGNLRTSLLFRMKLGPLQLFEEYISICTTFAVEIQIPCIIGCPCNYALYILLKFLLLQTFDPIHLFVINNVESFWSGHLVNSGLEELEIERTLYLINLYFTSWEIVNAVWMLR